MSMGPGLAIETYKCSLLVTLVLGLIALVSFIRAMDDCSFFYIWQ